MKIISIAAFLILFSLGGIAQELPYNINYNDRGPVIEHVTCGLAYSIDEFEDYEAPVARTSKILINFLSKKGYFPYWTEVLKKGTKRFSVDSFSGVSIDGATNNDLALKIRRDETNKVEVKLGYLKKSIVKEKETFNFGEIDFDFKYNYSLQYVSGVKFQKELVKALESLPPCFSKNIGHTYYENKFNEFLHEYELATCYRLAVKKKSDRDSKRILSTNFQRQYRDTKIDHQLHFFRNLLFCYKNLKSGKKCSQGTLTVNLSHEKSVELIDEYLKIVDASDLTRSVMNHLANTRLCSYNSNNIKKVDIEKVLKETRKTI